MSSPSPDSFPADPGEERVRRRLVRVQWTSSLLLVAALIAQLLARKWFRAAPPAGRGLPILVMLGTVLVFVFACALHARVKGRSAWFGLMGLLHLVGYLFICFMKRGCHRCGTLAKDWADTCPACGGPI